MTHSKSHTGHLSVLSSLDTCHVHSVQLPGEGFIQLNIKILKLILIIITSSWFPQICRSIDVISLGGTVKKHSPTQNIGVWVDGYAHLFWEMPY